MKFFLVGLAVLVTAYGQLLNEHHVPLDSLAAIEEIETLEEPSNLLADNGYRYKTVKRLRYRHRRDVNELASPEYLPPNQDHAVELPNNEYLAPIAAEAPSSEIASGVLADDGYRYKTVRKLRHRHRRDVSGLVASPEYLPPVQDHAVELPSNEYLAPIAVQTSVAEIASGVLADDGYRYKTVRKLRHRHRRDVNEIHAPEYLPPFVAPINVVAPAVADIPLISSEYLAPLQQQENILASDGYRYKTVKRFKVRRH